MEEERETVDETSRPRPDSRCTQRPGFYRNKISVEISDIGRWTRQLRIQHGLTRPQAALRLHISEGTVKGIENNQLEPSESALASIVAGYNLDRAQERFTRELAQAPVPLAPLAELRERARAPEWRARFARLDRAGVACAFIDPLWNVIAANMQFAASFPGVRDFEDNVALWHFHPGVDDSPSEQTILFRDDESAYLVAALRGALGRHRAEPRALELLRRLRADAAFSSRWIGTVAVAYGRGPDNPVHLLDRGTGVRYSLGIQLGKGMCGESLQFCTALPSLYLGPVSA
ncbi:helix-turn-helix domain-containing protein [Nocardia asteroides]|uniref:helix-turn-helix domain-containing protein n=1 Tax=Nocardia asteroides TaxID=1824 RepID=UPI001E5F7BB6|nr:helix-turn-helix domain-containing protein [Nocardia asteroides]UGT59880.1 helix-turn-helix transcriptional regulator [Nocardia asteroides]